MTDTDGFTIPRHEQTQLRELLAQVPALIDDLAITLTRHALDALAAAGYAVVRLPEPNRFPGGEVEWEFADPGMFGYVNVDGATLEVNVGDERISVDASFTTLEGIVPTPNAARDLAAALLAAADHQEKNR